MILIMGQYTSYYLYQKYEQREGQDPIPCIPSIYSIDADGTMEKVIKLENDPDCGYTPPPIEPIYRWYQIPITEDYICGNCAIIFRWADSGTTCIGNDKWQRSIKQYSEDEGETWQNVIPPVYSATSLIEADSEDCGYVPPTPPPTGVTKLYATYLGGTSYSAACDGNTELTKNDVRASDYSYGYMTTAEIGSCITTIGNNAFQECYSLSSVTIPNTVTRIGNASGDCTTYYGGNSFENCRDLKNISIPSSVTYIEQGTFMNSGLETINIPSSITEIKCLTFSTCVSLTSVTIPNSVTTIGRSAFNGCSGLTNVVIPNSVTELGDYTFFACYNLTGVTLSSSLTSIGDEVFDGAKLIDVTIPEGVTSIGSNSFRCYTLRNVTIPSTITSIGDGAFNTSNNVGNCKITINATTPPTIGQNTFGSRVNYIFVPSNSVSTYKTVWSDYADIIYPIGYVPSQDVGFTAYYADSILPPVEVMCETLDTYPNDETLKVIKSGNTQFNSGAPSAITVGDCVGRIDSRVFAKYNCSGITTVQISDSVKEIGTETFSPNGSRLTNVMIGSGITMIGSSAFTNCLSLTEITINATTPPTLGSNVFNSNITYIYVPSGSVSTYKSSWGIYSNKIYAIGETPETSALDPYIASSTTSVTHGYVSITPIISNISKVVLNTGYTTTSAIYASFGLEGGNGNRMEFDTHGNYMTCFWGSEMFMDMPIEDAVDLYSWITVDSDDSRKVIIDIESFTRGTCYIEGWGVNVDLRYISEIILST